MPVDVTGIHVKLKPRALLKRPKLAAHIAVVAAMWTEIEEELVFLFILGMRCEAAVAAAVLGKVVSLATRLAIVETALRLRFSIAAMRPFKRIARDLRASATPRNRLVHGVWAVHGKFPRELIWLKGITDPQLGMQRYSLRDLLEIERLLLDQHLTLKLFAESLVASIDPSEPEPQERFWRLTPRVQRSRRDTRRPPRTESSTAPQRPPKRSNGT